MTDWKMTDWNLTDWNLQYRKMTDFTNTGVTLRCLESILLTASLLL